MNAERALIPAEKMQPAQASNARKGDIALAILEGVRQIDHGRVKRHALALMHGDRPGEAQRNLLDPGLERLVFGDLPFSGPRDDGRAAFRGDDWKAVLPAQIPSQRQACR